MSGGFSFVVVDAPFAVKTKFSAKPGALILERENLFLFIL
jgi:hypothetical protein